MYSSVTIKILIFLLLFSFQISPLYFMHLGFVFEEVSRLQIEKGVHDTETDCHDLEGHRYHLQALELSTQVLLSQKFTIGSNFGSNIDTLLSINIIL